ncbi:hypothetical protein DUNSADRAFT_8467 [Dunaliella salina]|uniref:Uncharacterized protein n=1 Tax=Dunaliella salina TaxID=3046 RepID=A0ABQ7GJE9_DUNSA|nr:hypothetical protein DUNSADRAFT_8467 [Dunaliella salina]|eukprot:KAF5834740.1 hypothetical protein DUNSADRAFT_8467 [Dunaliella salina]
MARCGVETLQGPPKGPKKLPTPGVVRGRQPPCRSCMPPGWRWQMRMARQEVTDSHGQVKELNSRVDYLRAEREKLLKLIAGEQTASATAKQSLESLAARVRASEQTQSEVEASLRAQISAMAEEHSEHVAQIKQQYEAQLHVTDQEAQACLRRADSTQASSSKLVEVHNALRRERDDLWSKCEEMRTALSSAQSERDDLLSKVALLRTEAKSAISDLKNDRQMRLQNEQLQHQAMLSELKMQHERAALAMGEAHEHQMAGVLALADRLKGEVVEAQRVAEKHKSTIGSLKDQIKEVLVVRDVMAQELASEKQYNLELSQIVAQVKGSLPGRETAPSLTFPGSSFNRP